MLMAFEKGAALIVSVGAHFNLIEFLDRKRGGIHNSLTRILLKPNHIVGGYAQLAYFFNYIGPIGNNRDEVTMILRRTAPVEY